MKIIILGAGQVGTSVASNLASEANDITVVDVDGGRLRDLADRFADLVADGENRVERSHRFLKNHGDTIAPDAPHRIKRQLQKILLFKTNRSADFYRGMFLQKSQDGEGGEGFARARFPNQGNGLAFFDAQRDIVQQLNRFAR